MIRTLFCLAIKNIISRKSSFVIALFIAIAISMLIVTNAVFDRTEHGVEEVFVNSFTGDVVIRPKSSVPLSLFGDETPVTGELTDIDRLTPYVKIEEYLESLPSVSSFSPQVTGLVSIENGSYRFPIYLFGVEGSSYSKIMPSLSIVEGKAFSSGEKGIMLSKKIASALHASVGDVVQFTVADGPIFRIRAAPVTGIYVYSVANSTLDRFVIADPATVCSLMDITETVAEDVKIEESKTSLLDSELDLESLFESSSDSDSGIENDSVFQTASIDIAESDFSEGAEGRTSWNFIVCRLGSGRNASSFISKSNRFFKKNGWPVEAVDWRSAAGSTALYLYWMRMIFNVGILIVLAAGLIVVNNTLVVNVLDRTREIGTMRAIGASKTFISLQFMIETFTIAVFAGGVGCILGTFCSFFITGIHISFNNSFLIQLFGGNILVTQVTLGNLRNSFLVAVFLGLVGWVYPVQTAISTTPVHAMQGGS